MRISNRGVAATVAATVVATLAVLGPDATARERRDDLQAQRRCRGNLMRVGETLLTVLSEDAETAHGVDGWFVRYAAENRVRALRDRMTCDADPKVGASDTKEPVRGVFSYAIRDFRSHPLERDSKSPQVLAACPHHDDGAFVVTDDLDVRFLTRAALGVGESGAIQVGAAAKSHNLRVLRFETQVDTSLTAAQAQRKCTQHLRFLGQLFTTQRMERPGPPPYSGPALLLHYRKSDLIQKGRELALRCPLDTAIPDPLPSDFSDRYDVADLKHPPRELVSYAVRDFAAFPFVRRSMSAQSVMACTHHVDHAIVVFDDGAVQVMSRDRLGLGPDDPIVVGSDSKAELLRPLRMATSTR